MDKYIVTFEVQDWQSRKQDTDQVVAAAMKLFNAHHEEAQVEFCVDFLQNRKAGGTMLQRIAEAVLDEYFADWFQRPKEGYRLVPSVTV